MKKARNTRAALSKPSDGSRILRLTCCLLFALACGLCSEPSVSAQALTVRLKVVSTSPAVVRIEAALRQPADSWSFRNTYGRVLGLGERVENFAATDSAGNHVAVRRTSLADFKSEKAVPSFSYEVRVTEPANPADTAHVSWLNEQGGYLMLADLLPLIPAEAQRSAGLQIALQLPPQWVIASSAKPDHEGRFAVSDPIQAVFFVGKDLRLNRKQISGLEFIFATVGEWPFSGDSVNRIVARIMKDHARHVGLEPQGRAVLMLMPFPGTEATQRWTAETRGSNVVLLLGRNSPREGLLGRLSVILTHELFHLWVPGALSLDGDYDWFYEGFTLYQALRSAVRLGFIDFEEYLSTMARVYDSYLATNDRDRFSLLEASQRRWTMGSSLVYDKGMLVAFLCDLSLRSASRNRRSLDDAYRELFSQRRLMRTRADGNESLISLLDRELGSEQFTRRYLSTPSAVGLETELPAYGLMIESSGNRSHLKVKQALSDEQLRLLGSLGYRK